MKLPKKLMWDRSEDEGILIGGEDEQGNIDLEFVGLVEKDNPELAVALVHHYNSHDEYEKRDTIMTEALAEIKAAIDGKSDQLIAAIIEGCISELNEAAIAAAQIEPD